MGKYFTTFFDKNYLSRGKVLFDSMDRHIDDFVLYVLALDDKVSKFVSESNDSRLVLIELEDIERKYPELRLAKKNRSKIEFYFTLSPFLPLYILVSHPEIEVITSLDADIFFLNSPSQLFKDFEKYSIMITAHNFPHNLEHLEKYGKYNVSFQSFRRNKEGLECLNKWKEQCFEWCYDVLENDKFADQKYLDSWTKDFDNVLVLSDSRFGIAPWNANKYRIYKRGDKFFSGGNKLVFFHFHGLRFLEGNVVKHGLDRYNARMTNGLFRLYKEYIFKVSRTAKNIGINGNKVLRIKENKSERINFKLVIDGFAFYNFRNFGLFRVKHNFTKRLIYKLAKFL
jgi:hypothetical protein